MKKSNKKGFTLVELVIVIAVVAILAGILIPTFSGVTKDAKDAALDTDAKTLYTQYAEEVGGAALDDDAKVYMVVDNEGTPVYYYVNGAKLLRPGKPGYVAPEAGDVTYDGTDVGVYAPASNG